ncbi:hypothetical protein C5167_005759 [Papaver somniferum]|uniref:MADS-box domain-containing protein n=1 Tax=Papaver somniferum TaxID=3469 RepID=A0A4Y7JEW7_PAPSO|nr:hypothetical protein C5167_005759 [Papaver somniferum]
MNNLEIQHRGRGKKRDIKRIEDKAQRHLSFYRRKSTLLKKARDLSYDSENEVALIIFSSEGKLSEFSSTSSMLETLEKYERIKGILPVSSEPVVNDIEDEALQDYLQLKARAEVLQQNYRNLQGEGLETLRFEELDQLENQLEVTLKQVRSEKTQSMFGHLAELQQKEQMQREANKTLSKKMEEDNAETALRLSWKVAEQQRQQGMDEDKADMALQLSWHYNCHGKRAEMALQLSWKADEQQRQQQIDKEKAEMALQLSWEADEQQRQQQIDKDKAEMALQLSWQVDEQQRQQQIDKDKAEMALQLSWQADEQQRQQQIDKDKAEMTLQLSWQADEQQRQQQIDKDKAEMALQLSWQMDEQQRQQQMDEDKAENALQLSWHAGQQQWQQQMDADKAESALQLSWQVGEQQWQQQINKDKVDIALQLSWQAGEQQRQISYNHYANAVQSECFFQALECSPSSQIGNNHLSNTGNMMNVTAPAQDLISFLPGWML